MPRRRIPAEKRNRFARAREEALEISRVSPSSNTRSWMIVATSCTDLKGEALGLEAPPADTSTGSAPSEARCVKLVDDLPIA